MTGWCFGNCDLRDVFRLSFRWLLTLWLKGVKCVNLTVVFVAKSYLVSVKGLGASSPIQNLSLVWHSAVLECQAVEFKTILGKGLTATTAGSKPDKIYPQGGISKISTFLFRHCYNIFAINTYWNKTKPLPHPLPTLPLNIDLRQPCEASSWLLYFSLAFCSMATYVHQGFLTISQS